MARYVAHVKKRNAPCELCGTVRQRLHRDHILPKFKGGSDDDPANIQHICANCHEDKTREDMRGATWLKRRTGPHTQQTKDRISAAKRRGAVLQTPDERRAQFTGGTGGSIRALAYKREPGLLLQFKQRMREVAVARWANLTSEKRAELVAKLNQNLVAARLARKVSA